MKLSIIALSLFSLFAFSACKKEVTEVQQVKQAYSILFNLQPNAWQMSSDNKTATIDIPVPELDQYMYTNGGVLAYIAFDGTNYDALPETYDAFSYIVTHNVGHVYISISELSGNTFTPPNAILKAKVVLIDADPLN
ncbi:hypothetical protein QEG73_16175 [Chitinophagaceae bacterium 26-R-25]|nr:hypothetical protein [Chitinophagaceae bacterium 26-R-25]